jgi:hypothetical protein
MRSLTILVVDDERTYPTFEDQYRIVYVKSSANALEALRSLRKEDIFGRRSPLDVDEIWLDWDLGGDDTAKPVVDYLDEFRDSYAGTHIRILSSNPVGQKYIKLALGRHFAFDPPPSGEVHKEQTHAKGEP